MAGGMSRGGGIPLRDRVRRGGAPSDAGPTGSRPVDSGGRHCWVIDSPGHPGRWPGVLLEWRQLDEGWEGLIAYVIPEVPARRGVRLVARWVAAEHLEPATGTAAS